MRDSMVKRLNKFDEKCKHWRKLHKEDSLKFKKRILFTLLLGFTFHYTIYKIILSGAEYQIDGILFSMAVFFIFSESIFLFDKIIAIKFPWHTSVKKRIISLFLFAVAFFFIAQIYIPQIEKSVVKNIIDDPEKYKLILLVGFLYLIIYVILIIARNFHESLNFFVYENEKLKQDKILSDYKALQDQLNPHFLFNNLSTLIAIIHSNKDKAIDFAENFTDVYRYVLTKEGQVAVTLNDELDFLKSYTTLHLARIGNGLKVDIDVDSDYRNKKVPHLSLQILVENAIKHNITSKTKPLIIRIGIIEDRLYVVNNKQLKESTYSTKTGLSNLSKRLKILTDEELKIIEDEDIYRVEIPLIN